MNLNPIPKRNDADAVMQAESAKHKRLVLIGQLKPKPGQNIWKLVNGEVKLLSDDDYVGNYGAILTHIAKDGKFGLIRNKRIKLDPAASGYVVSGSRKSAKEKFIKMGLIPKNYATDKSFTRRQ